MKMTNEGIYLLRGTVIAPPETDLNTANALLAQNNLPPLASLSGRMESRAGSIAQQILEAHNECPGEEELRLRFDALASHDITYVGIIQTAIASGLKEFPVPYVLTNCHNSLCAVGGTINEDDHAFGFSAAQKFGGIFVPPHQAVIHQFMREMMSGCGKMILGSDSHTRYGALGVLAIGEGGGELAKQLLRRTYNIRRPEVVAVYLHGAPIAGVGPQDVALAIIGAVFKSGYVKNKVMEFVGPGIANLSVDFRNGIDVMTTETTCLSSIWRTDEKVAAYYAAHGLKDDYRELMPAETTYYDGLIEVDLAAIRPMIALPFHPSNVYTIDEVNANAADLLQQVEREAVQQLGAAAAQLKLTDKLENGRLRVDQGVVAGCAGGTYENLTAMAHILGGKALESFSLSVYPASQPLFLSLMENKSIEALTVAGASIRSAFCGPCFGAGDVPSNRGLSIRHTTRNFPFREGAKPADGQIAAVALMDARSIAATARNGGLLTAATEDCAIPSYHFHDGVYRNRIYFGVDCPKPATELVYGPNIVPWPAIRRLPDNLLLTVCAAIRDAVTTTDELIPSGETSSYRSNPLRLAEFTLSRKEPEYVARAKAVQVTETARLAALANNEPCGEAARALADIAAATTANTGFGSLIFAIKPGDGSAREQAASCQRVLGGDANIAVGYATKRYRSNLINWGLLPLTIAPADTELIATGDQIFLRDIRSAVLSGKEKVAAEILRGGQRLSLTLYLENLSNEDREILAAGCLINYYAEQNSANQ